VAGRVVINRVFDALRSVYCRYFCIYGGRRSSKSWSISQLLVRRALESVRKIVVMRKFATSLRMSVWSRVQAAIEECVGLSRCKVHRGDRTIRLPNGSTFEFVGADDAEKLKSIEGVSDFWFEEATEFTEQDFDVVDAGLSTPVTPQSSVWLSFNPVPQIDGSQHWLVRRFLGIEHEMSVPAVRGNVCVLRTWYKDNAFVPQPTINLLEGYAETNRQLYEQWALGEFVSVEGAILDTARWDVVLSVPTGVRRMPFGLDFGYSIDPCALIECYRQGDEIWLRERLYQAGLTTGELDEALEERGVRRGVDEIVADSAEPRMIAELGQRGWLIRAADKSGGAALSFKRQAAAFMQNLRIHIVEPSPNLQTEVATWSWKRDRLDNQLPIVADGHDHLIDAAIYSLFKPSGSISYEALEAAQGSHRPLRSNDLISADIEPLRIGAVS